MLTRTGAAGASRRADTQQIPAASDLRPGPFALLDPPTPKEVGVEITVKSRNCTVPSRVKEEAVARLAHATRFFDRLLEVQAVFAAGPAREPVHVEVVARAKGRRIRAEASGPDHRSALDAALARLERRLTKSKTRLRDRRRRLAQAGAGAAVT